MQLDVFVEDFADLFEDINRDDISAETEFQKLDDWDSLAALNVIALAKTRYSIKLSGAEIRACKTVKDLFDTLSSK